MAKCIPIIQKGKLLEQNKITLMYLPGIKEARTCRLAIFLKKPIKGQEVVWHPLLEGKSEYLIPREVKLSNVIGVEFWVSHNYKDKK